MGNAVQGAKLPKEMKFESGLLSDTATLAGKETITARSFMDRQGEEAEGYFDNEDAEEGTSRQDVIAGVRRSLLARMSSLNDSSRTAARQVEQEHRRHREQVMVPALEGIRARYQELNKKMAWLQRMRSLSGERRAERVEEVRRYARKAGISEDQLDELERNAAQRANRPLGINRIRERRRAEIPNGGERDDGSAREEPERLEQSQESSLLGDGDQQDSELIQDVSSDQSGEAPQVEGGEAGNAPGRERANAAAQEREEALRERQRQDQAALLNDYRAVLANRYDPRGAVGQFFTLVGLRRNMAQAEVNKVQEQLRSERGQVLAKSREWDRRREEHRERDYRAYSRAYDGVAMTWYETNRGVEDPTIPEGNRKRIAEYRGGYSAQNLRSIMDGYMNDPYKSTSVPGFVKYRETREGSRNEEIGRIKFHTTITALGFADGVTTMLGQQRSGQARQRIKLTEGFRGYRARRQFADAQERRLSLVDENQRPADQEDMQSAADLNLTADERGTNGAYLYSQRTAKIYTARRSFFGDRIHGFYMNGDFIADDGTVLGKADTNALRSPNWSKVAQEESIRRAVRRSDFFRHVNAATIQYYMTYNTAESFGINSIRESLGAQQGGNAPEGEDAGQEATPAQRALDRLRVYQQAKAQAQPGEVQDALARLEDAVRNGMGAESERSKRQIGVLLLAEDDPALWALAGSLAESMGGRFAARVQRTPVDRQEGRMALLGEFANDRGFDWTNILGSLVGKGMMAVSPNAVLASEDLMAKRDSFFSMTNLGQSLVDGTILSSMADALAAGFSYSVTSSLGMDNATAMYLNKFSTDYSLASGSAASTLGRTLRAAPAMSTLLDGGVKFSKPDDEEKFKYAYDEDREAYIGKASDTLFTIAGFVEDICAFVKECKKEAKTSKDKRNKIIAIIKCLISAVKNLVGALTLWLSQVCSWMPLVGTILGGVKYTFAAISEVVNLVYTGFEKSALTTAQEEIRTAMTAGGQGEAQEEGAEGRRAMASAIAGNAQTQEFLRQARDRANRSQVSSGFGVATNAIGASASVMSAGSTIASWVNPITLPFKLAEKSVQFIGWLTRKGMQWKSFKDDIGEILGNREYVNYAGFRDVIRRETGISNQHYLPDVSRIFTAIDTHAMINKAGQSDGEKRAAITMMAPYIRVAGSGEARFTNVQNLEQNMEALRGLKLDRLLGAVGAPVGNWRAVLRMSIAS